jgi:hypothetical protein
VLLNAGQPQVNEDSGGNGDTRSSQRCPNGSWRTQYITYLQNIRLRWSKQLCGANAARRLQHPLQRHSDPLQRLLVGGDIVISQVYGGGGNTGATLKNDFIEIMNHGSSPIN